MITMKFILDTNFLLIPGQFGVDIFSELSKFGKPEFCTLNLVVKELEKLSLKKGFDGRAANLALELIKEKGIHVFEAGKGSTDRGLEALAGTGVYIVCTQDRALIKRLKNKGLKAITLRQKKYLVEL